ncbi:MAG: HesA/MoeB/ThiF family protein [Anaerolineae bacterium]|jgi:adenylyltransferase/sulfurtransferase|nr:HesA/MoeB/ThiF family protein [Anaerolineae bacterium]
MKVLTASELERYQRHLILPQIDEAGQQKLKNAAVLIIGLGGLGSPAALYLAAAGIGRIGLMDDDRVSVSNLQRQVIHSEATVGQLKVKSAADRLHQLNQYCTIETYPHRFTMETREILSRFDIIIDATDNFAARYAINTTCVQLQKPTIYGAVNHFDGQISVFAPHLGGPCYHCVFPHQPQDTGEPVGVFGVIPGIIGSMQAAETLKMILGIGVPLISRLMTFSALDHEWYLVETKKQSNCPVCG